MIVLYIILGIITFNLSVYLFVFVRPKAKNPSDIRLLCDYAHRGLHDDKVPENSLEAFKRAKDNGYGIELDVQLSKDKEVMVFHDYALLRMTGTAEKLCNLTHDELKALFLKETNQKIPTFKEVLSLIDGKVPLLIELKGEDVDTALCPKVAEILKDYNGPFCIESFNPLLLLEMRKYLPNAYYGQLYTNVCRDKKNYNPLNVLLSVMAFNFLAKPNFIAFNKKDRKSLPVRLTTSLYKAPKFVWTAKGEKEISTAKQFGENAIFEKE